MKFFQFKFLRIFDWHSYFLKAILSGRKTAVSVQLYANFSQAVVSVQLYANFSQAVFKYLLTNFTFLSIFSLSKYYLNLYFDPINV